jgi:hypothetical protein
MLDTVRVKWYRYVIDFDLADQKSLNILFSRNLGRIFSVPGNLIEKVLAVKSYHTPSRFRILALVMMIFFVLAGGILVVQTLWTTKSPRYRMKRFVRRSKEETYTRQVIVNLYLQVLQRLRKFGYTPKKGQTPFEFASSVSSHEDTFHDLIPFTSIYYRLRFGDYHLTDHDIRIIQGIYETLQIAPPKF